MEQDEEVHRALHWFINRKPLETEDNWIWIIYVTVFLVTAVIVWYLIKEPTPIAEEPVEDEEDLDDGDDENLTEESFQVSENSPS